MPEPRRARAAGMTPRASSERVGADAKARLVDAFDVTLGQLPSYLGALIGADATSVLFRSACREAWQHYPWLRSIDVDAAASHVDRLRSHLGGITYVELRESLAACIETILALVADVTGDVLVRKMYPCAQQFRQHVEE